jgi:hypothetical protein
MKYKRKESNDEINDLNVLKEIISTKNDFIKKLENEIFLYKTIYSYEHNKSIIEYSNRIPNIHIQNYLNEFFNNKKIDYSFLDLSKIHSKSSKIFFLYSFEKLVFIGQTIKAWPDILFEHTDKDFYGARAITFNNLDSKELYRLFIFLINKIPTKYNYKKEQL